MMDLDVYGQSKKATRQQARLLQDIEGLGKRLARLEAKVDVVLATLGVESEEGEPAAESD